jgi:hypothetical protein
MGRSADANRPPPARYRTSVGTTLMLLNGEPLISLVLTTV